MNRWFYNPEAVEPPEEEEEKMYCPVCDHRIYCGEYLYFDRHRECIGCEYCTFTKFVEDCF